MWQARSWRCLRPEASLRQYTLRHSQALIHQPPQELPALGILQFNF